MLEKGGASTETFAELSMLDTRGLECVEPKYLNLKHLLVTLSSCLGYTFRVPHFFILNYSDIPRLLHAF